MKLPNFLRRSSGKAGRALAAPVLLGHSTPQWPDGTAKHPNICKSDKQLLSEIHSMLTALIKSSQSSTGQK
jgi:hypothetical protein